MNSPALLCIDDRPQMLELHKTTLEPHGYCVKLATSSYTAIKTLEETSVAAVLLEYKQEGLDAEAVACHIKQRFPNMPIILLSAYSEMPEQILWLVDEYVMKSELAERLGPMSVPACTDFHRTAPGWRGNSVNESAADLARVIGRSPNSPPPKNAYDLPAFLSSSSRRDPTLRLLRQVGTPSLGRSHCVRTT